MAVLSAANAAVKTVGDPNTQYETMFKTWQRSRAVCEGEKFVKEYDGVLDTFTFSNMLIPFSPSMTPAQYSFYKAEAEWPGITAQFLKTLVGGLLRKQPSLKLPEGTDESLSNWILHEFDKDDSPLASFMENALKEELQTSRAWVFIDYPEIEDPDNISKEDMEMYKPFPILYKAESIINWTVKKGLNGKSMLSRVIVRGYEEMFFDNEFHPAYVDTIWVHELDKSDNYQIRIYRNTGGKHNNSAQIGQGEVKPNPVTMMFELKEVKTNITANGERLTFIPAWPLNGHVEIVQPILTPFIDKEVSLYNKLSRRNHLLYGASSYTPVIIGDLTEDQFDDVISSGLGTWINLPAGSSIDVLKTPTEALADMDKAITSNIEEMAKLGMRMLTPEVDQSGIALEIRNAPQTAQLGSLNNRISNTMKQIISFMIFWKTGEEIPPMNIEFALSPDFSPVPVGEGWLRLATEWYQQGLIPRSAWINLLKHNDMLSADYDDETGQKEITENLELVMQTREDYLDRTTSEE
jgi:hypothetical protein